MSNGLWCLIWRGLNKVLEENSDVTTNNPRTTYKQTQKGVNEVDWPFKSSPCSLADCQPAVCPQGQMDEDVQKALKQILMMCKVPAQAKDACWDRKWPAAIRRINHRRCRQHMLPQDKPGQNRRWLKKKKLIAFSHVNDTRAATEDFFFPPCTCQTRHLSVTKTKTQPG